MFDASDSVYDYLICSICPVNLSKSGLSYDAGTNSISERVRDWIVGAPSNGFLFPAFNDRDTDIHSLLYFSKNPEELQSELIGNVLGANIPISAGNQKEIFHQIITNTFGEECDFETIKTIHENLNEMIEENKDKPEPLVLTPNEVKHIFDDNSIPNEKFEMLEKQIDANVGEKQPLVASNIAEVRKFQIEMPDVVIKVSPDRTDLVETRQIDGKQYLVIEVTDRIEVNGVSVVAGNKRETRYADSE